MSTSSGERGVFGARVELAGSHHRRAALISEALSGLASDEVGQTATARRNCAS